MNMIVSHHAAVRSQQRSIHVKDLDLAVQFGTETKLGYLITEKNYQEVEREMKRRLKKLHRLVGTLVAFKGGTVTTVIRTTRSQQKKLLSH